MPQTKSGIKRLMLASRLPRRRLSLILQPRGQRILQPTAWLGQACPRLSEKQRETIRAILAAHSDRWKQDAANVPAGSQVYAKGVAPLPLGRIAVVMPRHINCDPAFIEHDIAYHMANSAEDAGAKVVRYDADAITYSGSNDLPSQTEKLTSFFEQMRPDVVVFDGNYLPNGRTLDAGALSALRSRYGFRLVAVIPDCYDQQPQNALAYWGGIADLSVIFHSNSRYYREFPHQDRVLVCPTLPFHEGTLYPRADRGIEFYYSGSDSRNRRMFLEAAQWYGIETVVRFHNRRRDTAPSLDQFAEEMGRSKLTFTNGWLPDGDHILTGRVGEAILSGSVLLHEAGSPLDQYLAPFVHYVPVENAHELVAFSQFLLSEPEWRDAIATAARDYWTTAYSSRRFWTTAWRSVLS